MFCLLGLRTNMNLYYRGNWTTSVTVFQNVSKVQKSRIQMDLSEPISIDGLNIVTANVSFTNTSFVRFPKYKIQFYGLVDKNDSIYYLISVPYVTNTSDKTLISILNKSATMQGILDLNHPSRIYIELQNQVQDKLKSTTVVGLTFKMTIQQQVNSTFDLPNSMSGLIFLPKQSIPFNGKLFNVPAYVREGLIFGVLTAITLIINYYAWSSLKFKFETQGSLQLLSVHTYILHFSFDFSYGLLIFELAMTVWNFVALYCFLFIAMMVLYLSLHINQISRIWRSQNDEGLELATDDLKGIFFGFFTEISLTMSVASIAFSSINDYPVISVIYLYSFFIPQIIHSISAPSRKKHDEIFVILISLVRLFPLYYFTLYKNNLMEVYSPRIAVIATSYLFAQVIIILLQNRFGGNFFIPYPFKPKIFNYHSGKIEEDTECPICMSMISVKDQYMITPCKHCFHESCLSRWMEEEMVCPICRAVLPP